MANVTINDLSPISSVVDATQFETDTGGLTSNKATGAQIKSYVLAGAITQPAALVASGQTNLILSNSIPATAKRITINFYGIRQSGTAVPLIRLGTGGVAKTTGYLARSYYVNPNIDLFSSTIGFPINSVANSNDFYGSMVFTKVDPSGNKWVGIGKFNDGLAAAIFECAGGVELSGPLDMVQIIMANGTDTFTAGTASIMIE